VPITHEYDEEEERHHESQPVELALTQVALATKMTFWLPPCGVMTEK
jgi:hypothetical protein